MYSCHCNTRIHIIYVIQIVTHCNILQHTATRCNTLHHTATNVCHRLCIHDTAIYSHTIYVIRIIQIIKSPLPYTMHDLPHSMHAYHAMCICITAQCIRITYIIHIMLILRMLIICFIHVHNHTACIHISEMSCFIHVNASIMYSYTRTY